MSKFASLVLIAVLAVGCGGSDSAGESGGLALPEGFPSVKEPADNAYSEAKFTLGRSLFYDERLSLNQTSSCGTCHQQALAFTDGRARAIGSTGQDHPRGSQSLANVGYANTLTWGNPLLRKLEDQALIPLFNLNPVELGFSGREEELLRRFREDPASAQMFSRAFPNEDDPVSIKSIAYALAVFQRKIISGQSRYDKYVYQGRSDALSESAKRGLNLFFSERLECDHCHGGINFAAPTNHQGVEQARDQFENNGLYNIGGTGAYPANNTGLFEFTRDPSDMGKFRPPTLRNIELTAPYMHDGSIATLEEVIDHYSRGGRNIKSGPFAGDGKLSPYKSALISGFKLTAEEREDLLAFLRSLTDVELTTNPELSDPIS